MRLSPLFVRYNQAVQQFFGLTTKPENWLHCLIAYDHDVHTAHVVICIWDARNVLETCSKQVEYTSLYQFTRMAKPHISRPADDNLQPVQEVNEDTAVLNKLLSDLRRLEAEMINKNFNKTT